MGNMIVELCSAAILLSVWRYLSFLKKPTKSRGRRDFHIHEKNRRPTLIFSALAVRLSPPKRLLLDEMGYEVNGQGENDGRIFFGADAGQRLQVTQLKGGWALLNDLSGLF